MAPPVKELDSTQFSLNDCYLTSTSFLWLGQSGPGTYPTGWEPEISDGIVATSDIVEIVNCRRLGWDRFERPATLLIESHDKFVAPEHCKGEGSTWMVHRIWTNDSELAQFLSEAFAVPVGIASFSSSFDNSTELVRLTWSWTTLGGEPSELSTVVPLSDPQDSPLTLSRRYVWDTGAGISLMDVNYTALVPSSFEQVASGSFDDSMLHGSTGVSNYVGAADYWTRVSASGVVQKFGDYQCESLL